MNVSSMMKAVGRFIAVGPTENFVSGQSVSLCKGHLITRNDLDPPRTYIAISSVTFVLSDDAHQLDDMSALKFVEPKRLTGPKPGETWRRKVRHSSDEKYNFACVARDDFEEQWFVWHRSDDGEAFVISKDDFFTDRDNWEQV